MNDNDKKTFFRYNWLANSCNYICKTEESKRLY